MTSLTLPPLVSTPAAAPADSRDRIPLVDLKAEYAAIGPQIDEAIRAVIADTAFVRGPFAKTFEREWAAYCGASHAVGCANGTAALELALRALGVGPGDEVITTPMTFIATVEAIVHTGATPVLADIDPATCNLSLGAAAAAITPRTRVVMPVALYGQPADMTAFRRLADANRLWLVEDAAQAQGASWNNQRTGSDGVADVTAFSFYPGKNLGAYGDAGAVTTADGALADKISRLADHGRAEKYTHDQVGFNYRMDGLQAAILSVKLRHLETWNASRRRLARRYDALLAPVTAVGNVIPVSQVPEAKSAYHLYVVRIPRLASGLSRDSVLSRVRAEGIEAGIHYPVPLHLQPALASLGYSQGAFPVAEQASDEILSLPLFPLMTEDQQDRVVSSLLSALG